MNEKNFWNSEKFQIGITIFAGILALFLLVNIVSDIKLYPYLGRANMAPNTITVSGDSEVYAVPDVALFSFSIVESAKTVSEAQGKVQTKIEKALEAMKAGGIEEKDIKTTDYSVYPKYEYQGVNCALYSSYCPPSKSVIVGYEVNQTISVKVRNVADAGTLLGKAGEAGASNISGLQFVVDKEEEKIREAREQAIKEAKEQANELAKSLGVKIVRIVSFNESGNRYPYYAKEMAYGMGGDGASVVPSLPTGENKITSNVSITFEIR